jgi:predicted DNA-binding ribbon-helix-helix protein
MTSLIVIKSIVVNGRKTTVGIEKEFWTALKDVAKQRGVTLTLLISAINTARKHDSLASAIRLCVLQHYQILADRAERPIGLSSDDQCCGPQERPRRHRPSR